MAGTPAMLRIDILRTRPNFERNATQNLKKRKKKNGSGSEG
jgi:hypothetical protein